MATTQTNRSVLFYTLSYCHCVFADGLKWPYQSGPLQHEPARTNAHIAHAISKPNDTIDVTNKIAMVLPFVDPMIKIKQN